MREKMNLDDQPLTNDGILSPIKDQKPSHELVSSVRMKNILRSNPNVGKLNPVAPFLVVKATEKLLVSILDECEKVLAQNNNKVIVHSIVKKAICDSDKFKIFHELMNRIPDTADDSNKFEKSYKLKNKKGKRNNVVHQNTEKIIRKRKPLTNSHSNTNNIESDTENSDQIEATNLENDRRKKIISTVISIKDFSSSKPITDPTTLFSSKYSHIQQEDDNYD